MKKLLATTLLLSSLLISPTVISKSAEALSVDSSVDVKELTKKKKTSLNLYLSPQEAYDFKKNNEESVLFIDVRTPAEIEFVGYSPIMDKNIPYELNDFSELDEKKHRYKKLENTEFMKAIEAELALKKLDKQTPVILMCRSGSRSAKAANLLADSGFKQVYSIPEGFEGDKSKLVNDKGHRTVNGWKNADLPWTYKVDISKAFATHK